MWDPLQCLVSIILHPTALFLYFFYFFYLSFSFFNATSSMVVPRPLGFSCPSSSWFHCSSTISFFNTLLCCFHFFYFLYMNEIFLVKHGPEYKNSKLNNYNRPNINIEVLKHKKQAHQY